MLDSGFSDFCCAIYSYRKAANRSNVFSVGNGDNCLIKTPKNEYILIDTGRFIYNGLSTAKTITLEYLYDNNIQKLDTVIVTHYDSDHAGGLLDILKNVKVKNLIMPRPECNSQNSCEIQKYILENKINCIAPYTGQNFSFKPNIELINYVPDTGKKGFRNDFSTITLLKAGNYKFLFMADAGVKSYEALKKQVPPNIDVLKAAHHGAKYTVDAPMLSRLRPVFSVLSTGKNKYNHPAPQTVALLKDYSILLSTQELGAIKFEADANGLRVYHFDSNQRRYVPIKTDK